MIRSPRTHWILPWFALVVASFALAYATLLRPPAARAQAYPGYDVVAEYPHDPDAFTEGLAFRRSALFEGTGLEGFSSLRRIALLNGEVTRSRDLGDKYFGEGITVLDGKIFQLTWQNERAFVYDAKTFKRIRIFDYNENDDTTEEGWGLTDNGRLLVMSNGTDVIRFRYPKTFEVTREIHVTDGGVPVSNLNELEWVEGEIFANVFSGDDVVRIDPHTGEVTGRFNLTPLHDKEAQQCHPEVTNGIAYMRAGQRLFVTGKYWCHIYEIELTDPPDLTPSPTG